MLITQDTGAGRFVVKAYEPGRLQINETDYTQTVLLTPQQVVTESLSSSMSALHESDLMALLATEAEVLILGTGARQQFPPMALLKTVYQQGRTLEVMDTRAAAHTFVVLASEGRHVAALMFV